MKKSEKNTTFLFDMKDKDVVKKSDSSNDAKTIYKIKTLNLKDIDSLKNVKLKDNDKIKNIRIKTSSKDFNKYYDSILLFINDKKIDPSAYKIVKKFNKEYDIFEYIKDNEKLISNLRSELVHNAKYEGATDEAYANAIISKYLDQLIKARFWENLNYYSKKKNITPSDMAKTLGISISTVSDWYNGVNFPRPSSLTAIAKVLQIPVEALTRDSENRMDYTMQDVYIKEQQESVKIPLVGRIPAGIPNEAIEYIEDWEEIPATWVNSDKQFFALKINGTSMEPKYQDGDVVIFLRASSCPSGKNCAVMIDNTDVTFKKFIKTEAGIILQPLNDKEFEPIFYSNKDILEKNIKIIGLPKEIRRQVD